MSCLAQIFLARLLNIDPCASDSAWDLHLVAMLQKKGFANRVKQFRPIASLPVLYKLYSKCLLFMCCDKLDALQAPQFAFRAGYQGHEVVFILRNLVEKALEWSIPLFVLDGDLEKAYDYTVHSAVVAGLEAKSVPSVLSAAWLREVRRFGSVFKIDEHVETKPIRRGRSLLQGDPASPPIFNSTLDLPAAAFCTMAKEQGWGYPLDDGTKISLVLFADNFWLFSSGPRELSIMTAAWLEILKKYGWNVPLQGQPGAQQGPMITIIGKWKCSTNAYRGLRGQLASRFSEYS